MFPLKSALKEVTISLPSNPLEFFICPPLLVL
jgi:hypothetical protein